MYKNASQVYKLVRHFALSVTAWSVCVCHKKVWPIGYTKSQKYKPISIELINEE